jgi:hypothetical protein
MNKLIRAAASAALLHAFAFSAHAEELHKDGAANSSVKLSYEATALPNGLLQIVVTLECRQAKLDEIYGVGAMAVINKAGGAAEIQQGQLSCTAKGGANNVPMTHKATATVTASGVSPGDIGTKLFVLGRVEKGKSPRTEGIMKKAEEALKTEMDKVTAS